MNRAFHLALRLYPWDYRARFAREILDNLQESPSGIRELGGLLKGALQEWNAKLTTSPMIRGRVLPDVRLMRPPGVPREAWFK
jgi:hypothetical protein